MSANNIKGAPFAILSDKGYYQLYDNKGNLIDLLTFKVRITQQVCEPDQILITGIVNVMKDKEQMMRFIEENNTRPPTPPKDTVVKNGIRRPVE